MKTKLLIIIATILVSLLATDQYYLSLQDQEIKKSDWVQNCVPPESYQVVPLIGLYNHTHSFDLLTCTWNPTEHGTSGFLESLYTSFIEPIFLDIVDGLEIKYVYADCNINTDWSDAPCLDQIINGKYQQHEVDKWTDYYSYKGSIFMEEKHLELNQAIKENNLQEWVDESMSHRNVYEYYFFSGRAPNTGEYYGNFDKFMINERSTIHDPYTDDERYQLASKKVGLGGLGINPEFDLGVIISGITIGVGSAIGLTLYWRTRK